MQPQFAESGDKSNKSNQILSNIHTSKGLLWLLTKENPYRALPGHGKNLQPVIQKQSSEYFNIYIKCMPEMLVLVGNLYNSPTFNCKEYTYTAKPVLRGHLWDKGKVAL